MPHQVAGFVRIPIDSASSLWQFESMLRKLCFVIQCAEETAAVQIHAVPTELAPSQFDQDPDRRATFTFKADDNLAIGSEV
jgi:hypothetical protein